MPIKLFCPFLTLKEKQQNNKIIKKLKKLLTESATNVKINLSLS